MVDLKPSNSDPNSLYDLRDREEEAASDGAAGGVGDNPGDENFGEQSGGASSRPNKARPDHELYPKKAKGFGRERLHGYEYRDTLKAKSQDSIVIKGADFLVRHKKGAAAGGGAGILGGLIIAAFFALLPLKIDFFVTRLDAFFGAGPSFAMTRLTDHLVSNYYTRYIFPNLYKGGICHSTITKDCAGVVSGEGPVKALYRVWRTNHIETKLATKYGIVFSRVNGQMYMKKGLNDPSDPGGINNPSDPGTKIPPADFQEAMAGKLDIQDLGDEIGVAGKGERTAFRQAIRTATEDMDIWDRTYVRFFIGPVLDKYGIKRCVIGCDVRDPFADSVGIKLLAAKAEFMERVVGIVNKEYGFAIGCVLGGGDLCSTDLQKPDPAANASDGEPLSSYQEGLQSRLLDYVAGDAEKLAEVVDLTKSVSERGFMKTILFETLAELFSEKVAQVGVDAVPIVGWVLLAAQVIHIADKIGPTLRFMGYATNAAAAVNLFMMYKTVDSEAKSGHVDLTEFGSFAQALSTNLSGSPNDQVDATTTPLYGAMFGGGAANTAYRCNDGSTVPTGQVVCPEEKLDRGNAGADAITNGINKIPGLTGLANVLNIGNDFIGWIVSHGFDAACYVIIDHIPPFGACSNAIKGAAPFIQQISFWFINHLIETPFTDNMSGGRTFDMMAAGADVSSNKECQVTLGCAKLSNQQIAVIRNQETSEQKAVFEQRPIFARLFSTDTPYSLMSQLAVAMPASLPQAANNISVILANPLSSIGSLFSTMLGQNKAFAATQPMADPFGVVQYGYTDTQIPTDPETYWDQHCRGDYSTAWFGSQTQDIDTGEALALAPEPCLLITAMAQANGVIFDSTMAPAGSLNPD